MTPLYHQLYELSAQIALRCILAAGGLAPDGSIRLDQGQLGQLIDGEWLIWDAVYEAGAEWADWDAVAADGDIVAGGTPR